MSIPTTNFFEESAIFSQNPSSCNRATIFYTLTNRKARCASNHSGSENERFARTKMQRLLFSPYRRLTSASSASISGVLHRSMPTQAHKLPQVQNREKQKKKAPNFAQSRAIRGFFGGEQGIRTLEHPFRCYTISNRAPSASSDNSPYTAGARCVRLFTFNPRPGSKRRTDSTFPQTYPWTAASGWGWDNGR